ncbi:DUF2254 domain-containing protein [Gordonia soli]|uniref:DUF2254 domain-containing protein n=1 Tax=Gordonia soli NBRC 108243 TaxID=1223545 RepID=M0QKV4_9ACTN|nr:DUF2254 family protein [Gordonia soli]GAC69275.1 hypothetical protein GS4_23_00720 [Gordonia soli NBRC 108243]
MTRWFEHTVVDTGRLPLFFLLVAFVLTFLFIRFSVRMIRAEVSWWPGNVTPGGVHMHHEFFGVILMLLSGFALVALANFETPIANCVLASFFGIGSALVLDEFALILHLRDVYWEEEGRSSIDAVFVAVAIGLLFLLGLRPIGFGEFDEFREAGDTATRVVVLIALAIIVGLAVVTLLKGKLWTGLVGLFVPPLLFVGALRVARPASPWARWRYTSRPGKRAKSLRRERRYREPVVRWKIVLQEAVAGRFGIPDEPPALPLAHDPELPPAIKAPNALATAIRWRRTRHQLELVPIWRLPVILVSLAMVAAFACVGLDDSLQLDALNAGTTATLLAVIAGAMATLTGLVFTAVTLAMQFGASQISIRVVPMLQREPVMRWSIGVFLATFVFTLIVALDLTVSGDDDPAPGISTGIALALTLASAYLFIALVAKVGSILNSAQLLRWIDSEGRGAIRRAYPADAPLPTGVSAPADAPVDTSEPIIINLREIPTRGRVLLAIDLPRIQRLALRWDVRVDLLVGIGDYVPHSGAVFEVRGDRRAVRPHQLLAALLFGDTHRPAVSPAAALQSISDIALKALSPAVNDASRAVQALDHIEDLLLMLAPRVHTESNSPELSTIRGYRRSWADYVSIGTDEIRHHSRGSAQVQRRLRALFDALSEQCSPEQQAPLRARIDALDEQLDAEWAIGLDRDLARASDRQGFGTETGRWSRVRRLSIDHQRERGADDGGVVAD